jgi:hypothetical protein
VNETATEMVYLGVGWITVGVRPKAPAGALGVDYGDFFPRGWGKGRRIREYSPYWDNFPLSIFQF